MDADLRAADEGTELLTGALRRSQGRRELERKAGAILVLVAHALERAAFFSLTASLIYFLTAKSPPCLSDGQAATVAYLFIGTTDVLSLLGGLLADCVASRFAAVAVGYAVYAAAFVLAIVYSRRGLDAPSGNACQSEQSEADSCGLNNTTPSPAGFNYTTASPTTAGEVSVTLVLMLAGVAAGAAVVHTNLAAFGADQVREQGMKVTRGYFSWLHWTRNVGAAVSLTGFAYLQGQFGFYYGSIGSLSCLLLSAAIFFGGRKLYVRRSANRQAIKNFLKILPEAIRVKRQCRTSGWMPNGTPGSTLDYAKVYYGGSYHDKAVEEIKACGRMLVIYVVLVPYWIGFSQVTTLFPLQGFHMEMPDNVTTSPSPTALRVRPSVLMAFDCASVLVTLPLLNYFVYPYTGRRGRRLTLHVRIAIGILLESAACIVAGVVETVRLDRLVSGGIKQYIGTTALLSCCSSFEEAVGSAVSQRQLSHSFQSQNVTFSAAAARRVATCSVSQRSAITGLFSAQPPRLFRRCRAMLAPDVDCQNAAM